MLKDLYEFKKDLSRRGIFFCLSGPISQNLVAEIGSTLEQKMNLEDTRRPTVLRVFSTVVENAQNIMRYSDEKEEKLSLGIIAVGYEDDEHYFVLCGNMVENRKVERLRNNLTKLRKMDKHQLKEYYRKKRREGPPEESKGGAGLGFIDMAKKASKPIEFDFKEINEKFHFFSMKTVI